MGLQKGKMIRFGAGIAAYLHVESRISPASYQELFFIMSVNSGVCLV